MHITDSVLGRKLNVLEQCVVIDVAATSVADGAKLAGVKDAGGLCEWLHMLHAQRSISRDVGAAAAALLTGQPAAGKTSLLSQLVVLSLDRPDAELVPIVVKVQLLQARLIADPRAFSAAWNWVDAFLYTEYHIKAPQLYYMLRQAMLARRALILLDGLDEGGEKRSEIEHHTKVLALQGHVLFATSRPDGVDEAQYQGFFRLRLMPLTPAQQHQALEQRLGSERAAKLRPYLAQVPLDTKTGSRITENPLMLSMVASIFELRHGLGMPESVVELYAEATKAMLTRAQTSVNLAPILQAVFLEAHVAQRRVITEVHLEAAAQQVSNGDRALKVLRDSIRADAIPLLSLLKARPLELQAAHLTFQEFFAARAIAEGSKRLSTPPWALPVGWANAVRLGLEMGAEFAQAMYELGNSKLGAKSVRVAAVGDASAVAVAFAGVVITGDRFTAAAALGGALRAASHVEEVCVGKATIALAPLREHSGPSLDLNSLAGLSRHAVGGLELLLLGGLLHSGGVRLKVLSLSRISGSGAAVLLDAAPLLTRLDISGKMDDKELRSVGRALLGRESSSLGSIKCDWFEVHETATSLNCNAKNLNAARAILLASALKFNAVLTSLNLAGDLFSSEGHIGPEGATAIAEALKVNRVLTTLGCALF